MKKASILLPNILIILLLCSCVSSGGYTSKQPWEKQQISNAQKNPNNLSVNAVEKQPIHPTQNTSNLPAVKVAILLPLTGEHKKLGQSMLNAAQMALFDLGHDNFILMPKDTKGTAAGAQNAASSAVKDNVQLILGPVFSSSVKAAQKVTQKANINMIAFSTNWKLANPKTFLISFLPFDQVKRVINYAQNYGYNNIGILSPKDSYGDAVISAYKSIKNTPTIIERFSPNGNDLGNVIIKFSNYNYRKSIEQETNNTSPPPFDAILMPAGGAIARQVSSFLNHYDMPARSVKRLGTGLMDDPTLARDKTLDGTWFAAPPPQSRQKFERRYKSTYYKKPPRIASLAYDATALAAILARMGLERDNRPAFDYASITNPNGFNGVDGIFRFRPDGIVERGLAVLEYKRGTIVVIDQAPRTFQRNVF